ncbi:hypothetical protein Cgig2_021625 [Carnegiea gigantea]|uniref:Uncharacterized protein n=1 Tax=Carnegiea gigantea TaxID=171969 RepID=A0A9Q1Q642_9CARY|nr:hypothetical protein Cgig2_021625 [Carnegiea gigantea]
MPCEKRHWNWTGHTIHEGSRKILVINNYQTMVTGFAQPPPSVLQPRMRVVGSPIRQSGELGEPISNHKEREEKGRAGGLWKQSRVGRETHVGKWSEARKSPNRPPAQEVLDNLIYNYSPTYCGQAGRKSSKAHVLQWQVWFVDNSFVIGLQFNPCR